MADRKRYDVTDTTLRPDFVIEVILSPFSLALVLTLGKQAGFRAEGGAQ